LLSGNHLLARPTESAIALSRSKIKKSWGNTEQMALMGEMFIGTDLNLYYDARHRLWQKRPDWFLVLGVSRAQH